MIVIALAIAIAIVIVIAIVMAIVIGIVIVIVVGIVSEAVLPYAQNVVIGKSFRRRDVGSRPFWV